MIVDTLEKKAIIVKHSEDDPTMISMVEKLNQHEELKAKAELLDEAVTIIQNCNMIFRNEFSDEYIENSSTIGFEIRIIQSFLNKIQKAKGE